MPKPQIAQHGRLIPLLENELTTHYDVIPLWSHPDAVTAALAYGRDAVGLVTSAPVGATCGLIDALPQLKMVASFGVGFDKLDLVALRERGVRASYTPEVLNDCVADTAFGLLIDVARGLSASDRFVRRGDWLKGKYTLTTRVSGKRLGIFGLGRIGQTIARRASGFDMQVRYTNRNPVAGLGWTHEPSLYALAEWADFLVVAAAGNADTHNVINSTVLQALGPQGFLINISRGSLVDESALVHALQTNQIAGAGLDVFADEPRMPEALWALDNVVLLPHLSSGTHETRQAMADLVLANLQAHFSGAPLPTPIPGL